MAKEHGSVKIIVALIALVGALGAAAMPQLLGGGQASSNRTPVQPPSEGAKRDDPPSEKPKRDDPPPESVKRDDPPSENPKRDVSPPGRTLSADRPRPPAPHDISGRWRELGFPGESRIVQTGTHYTTYGQGVGPTGVPFRSWGEGEINGLTTTGQYRTESALGTSVGRCQGTVSADLNRIRSSCIDSAVGQLTLDAIRQ